MRKILNKYIVSLVCFAAANLFAQTSNPGYLGKTRVVNFGVEGFLSFMDGMPMRYHQGYPLNMGFPCSSKALRKP